MEEQELNHTRNAETPDENRKNNRPKPNRNRNRNRPRPENAGEKPNSENPSNTPRESGKEKRKDAPRNASGNRPEKQRNGGKNPGGQNPPKEQKRERNNDRKKQRRQGGNPRSHRGMEDLYGTPTEDEVLTAEEWRAKIVLKAADGSIPSATRQDTATTAPEPPEEPMEALPTDLLIPGMENPEAASAGEDSVEVVGVRFRAAGKVYYFDPKGLKIRLGAPVIVETARGPEFGDAVFGNRNISKKNTVSPLRPVLRLATPEDVEHDRENRAREKEAFGICQEKIAAHKLDMKLIDVQYAFDNSKLLFYFTSDGRVDFRDLVKDLASVFHTRIELRQIGIRDEARMLGGLGACGRPLCCASFLPDFAQVSIKMAKEQNLSLNSAKISGVCGRLMCCLRYESNVYAEEIRRTPPNDSTVKTADGIGTVIGSNPLAGTVKVLLKNSPDTPPKFYSRDEVTVLGREKSDADEKKS